MMGAEWTLPAVLWIALAALAGLGSAGMYWACARWRLALDDMRELREHLAIARTQRDEWIRIAEERGRHWQDAVAAAEDAMRWAGWRRRGPKPSAKRPAEPRDEGLEADVLRDIEDALRGGDDE